MLFYYLLSIIFLTILLSMVRNTYTFDEDCFTMSTGYNRQRVLKSGSIPTERYKFPLYAWVIIILLSWIPYVGWLIPLVACILLITAYNDKEYNIIYKSGKIISFLTKKI